MIFSENMSKNRRLFNFYFYPVFQMDIGADFFF